MLLSTTLVARILSLGPMPSRRVHITAFQALRPRTLSPPVGLPFLGFHSARPLLLILAIHLSSLLLSAAPQVKLAQSGSTTSKLMPFPNRPTSLWRCSACAS